MKAIVIGAGVLGAHISYQLAKRGVEVTTIDKGIPGDSASAASLAWLNSNTKEYRPYHDLNVMSITEYNFIARELGSSDWLNRSQNVHIANSESAVESLLARAERLHSYGYAAIPLAPKDLPLLDRRIRVREEYLMGLVTPGEAQVSVPLLIHDLLSAAARLGAIIRHSVPVAGLVRSADDVRGVVLEGGERLSADIVVLAAGADNGALLGAQGFDAKTDGSLGATVTTSPGTSNVSTLLHLPDVTVRPDTNGRIVIRNAETDKLIDRETWSIPDEAIRELVKRAAAGLTDTDADTTHVERVRIAVRPYPIDGLPIVGSVDGLAGVYVTTMHSGVTLGAIIGRLAAEEIVGGGSAPLLEGFRPSRVINSDSRGADAFDPLAIEGEKISSR